MSIAAAAVLPSISSADATKAAHDSKMQWWREARYGMFIHWGLYAVPGGVYNGKDIGWYGEWIMNSAKIPVDEYAKFAKNFNPVQFDADAWAELAKQAGMKYLVITAKHHDGFCMYDTQVDDFNIVDGTPFKRNPIKELSAACAKRGIQFGVYYSQAQDWSHPGGGIWGKRWDQKQEGNYDEYLQKVSIPQVRELLAEVKPAVLWFDTPIDMKPERTQEFLEVLKPYPALIYNNRLGNGVHGDTETPEQEIPARGFPGRDWETCMTMNDTWGYKPKDNNYKSTQTLLRNLIDIASKNGNYLLNVGPTPEGVIPQPQVDRLKEVGAWLKVNGEAIYGTSSGPYKNTPAWGRATSRPGKLYLHVFAWPKDGKLLVTIPNPVKSAKLLANPAEPLRTTKTPEGVEIHLPASAPDPIASVIALDVEGEIAPIEAPPVAQADDASLLLNAADAVLHGPSIKLEGHKDPNIGFWSNLNDSVTWQAKISKPGEFAVSLNLACAPGHDGGEFTFTAGSGKLSGKTTATAGWNDYKSMEIGRIRLEQPGTVAIEIKATKKPGLGLMNLRSVTLKPCTK
jgi:alpha-L-fucosidase